MSGPCVILIPAGVLGHDLLDSRTPSPACSLQLLLTHMCQLLGWIPMQPSLFPLSTAPSPSHLLCHVAIEPHGPLAGVRGDPQGGHGGQQVDYNHQEDGQQHGAREGARRVVHLAGECGDRVPGKEVGVCVNVKRACPSTLSEPMQHSPVVQVPEHHIKEGAPVHRLQIHLQPVPRLDVRDTEHSEDDEGDDDDQDGSRDGVADHSEAAVVEVGQRQGQAEEKDPERETGIIQAS